MRIAIFNGSPRKQNTAAMIDMFCEAAQSAGHETEVLHVGRMNIAGCRGCEYCHTKGEGKCIQKDDFDKLMDSYVNADVIVFASPIYYFGMTAQMEAAIQRVYCIGKPAKAKKAVLLLSSGSPDVYDGAVSQFKGYMAYAQIENAGIVTAAGDEYKSEEKKAEIKALAVSL